MSASILYSLLAMVFFGSGVFFYKLGTPNFSVGIGASIFIASHLVILGSLAIIEKTKFNTGDLKFLIIGGLLAGLAQVFFFLALKTGKLHVVVPIRNLALLVTILLGVLFLAEKITLTKLAGILLGVSAIILLSL